MHVVVFGLTITSSWGNGHATLWRSLVSALVKRGHTVTFFEKDMPYYASTRDLWPLPKGAHLHLYQAFEDVSEEAQRELNDANVGLCTSFCPDGIAASELILNSRADIRAFYDMDTPVTLNSLRTEKVVDYLLPAGLYDFDLVLSYTGGQALTELKSRLGARKVVALYGWVDPQMHYSVEPVERFRAWFSYLGTYSGDRQGALSALFLQPASLFPERRFLIGGAQYPEDFPWSANIFFTQHLEPAQHPAFFSSSRATLNVTRRAMAEYGYCPSGRLFEAAACGTAILSDGWKGLDSFFMPGKEILCVHNASDVIEALSLSDEELRQIAEAARERTLQHHTAERRVLELEAVCEQVISHTQHEAIAS